MKCLKPAMNRIYSTFEEFEGEQIFLDDLDTLINTEDLTLNQIDFMKYVIRDIYDNDMNTVATEKILD
jgi:hypothetical protein